MFGLMKKWELVDREADLYKKEKFLEIDKQIEDYRAKRQTEMTNMALMCHEQLGTYEHDFHQTKETRGIELAKLEAKIEALREVIKAREETINADQHLHTARKAEIDRLNAIILQLINKQPNVTVQQMKQ